MIIKEPMSKKSKHIKLEDHPKLSENVFHVPDGYFNSLHDKLMDAVETEESMLNQSEHLKKHPFEVPENYFEELTEQIMAKTINSEAKVIPLTRQNWFRWTAVAATLILAVSFYFLLPSSVINSEESLSAISDETIIEYLNAQQHGNDELFNDVDSIDLILDELIADELDVYADILSSNSELNYDFEYFDY